MKKVTKFDLLEAVYQRTKYERKTVQEVMENLLSELKDNLKEGATIELRGFGTFMPRLRKGRTRARNPRTGEQLSVAPHYVTVFRAGQELKNALRDLPVSADVSSTTEVIADDRR